MDEMSDDYDDEVYGDTDTNSLPDDDTGQGAPAGDGLPGYPINGRPDWRAGVSGSGNGLLGMARVDQTPVRAGDPTVLLVSDSRSSSPTLASDGKQAYPMPGAYVPDGHGGVKLRPDFAAAHPKGPFDFGGMANEIHWPGVVQDLGKIGAGVAASIGAGMAAPFVRGLLGFGAAAPTETALGAAGSGATPNPWITGSLFGWRLGRTLHKQNKANPRNADPVIPPGVDRVSNGLP
jgi:hypothetical protein